MQQRLATRLDSDWLASTIGAATPAALNTVGLRTLAELELLTDGVSAGRVGLCDPHAEAAGIVVATALLERQAAGDCDTWELRLWVCDGEEDTFVLLREWHCPR